MMKKYKESLKNTPEPIMPSQLPDTKLDLRGLMSYAKKTGRKVIELTDEEKRAYIKRQMQGKDIYCNPKLVLFTFDFED